MSEALLTIVDADQHTLELIRRILEKANYRVTTEKSAETALAKLAQKPPALIITELQLENMDGFAFLETLHQHPDFKQIPTMVLSARRDADDKLKARELGAQAYVDKPFQRQEFLARIEQILHKNAVSRIREPKSHKSTGGIFDKLLKHNILKIQPKISSTSNFGYDYLQELSFLGFQNNQQAVSTFDKLAESDLIERQLIDVVHLCPFCTRQPINFREVCPDCDSLNIWIQKFYLHKTCGHKTWKSNLNNEKIISCTGCGQVLTSSTPEVEIGYAYHCLDCGSKSNEININCRCLNCGRDFDVSKAIKKEIFAYQVKQESTGLEAPLASTVLIQILETRTPTYLTLDELAKKLDLEILRAQRHQTSITLISIEFQQFMSALNLLPPDLATSLTQDIVKLINRSLRKNDALSLKNNTQLIILLPQTHQNIAKIIGHKILHDLETFNDKIQLEMQLASYPEDGINSEEILNVLDLGLEKLNEKI